MADETAISLLKKYGYTVTGEGRFSPSRPTSETWVQVSGGWECYAIPSPTFGGGEPWGQIDKTTGLVKVPYGLKERYANTGGLHPATHPECFDFTWPEERLVEIYAHTGEGWERTESGELKKAK